MNNPLRPESMTVNVRITLDVSYHLNGENLDNALSHLRSRCELAIGEGLLIGKTAASVDKWQMDVSTLPTEADIATQEAEIAAFLQQRIEDGSIDTEGMAMRLTRHSLMTSVSSTSELHERMRSLDSNSSASGTCGTAPAKAHDEIKMPMAVACVNASGIADMPVFIVNITQDEYDLGMHYDKAKALAAQAGYEAPFVCFEAYE